MELRVSISRQIKEISKAAIVVHRDRDYMEPDEIELWKKEIIAAGAQPFVEIDVESYFAADDYISLTGSGLPGFDLKVVKLKLADGEHDDCLTSYVNGRVDLERKSGNIAKLNYGKLSAAAARKASADPLAIMKGKKKLAKLRISSKVSMVQGSRFGGMLLSPSIGSSRHSCKIFP